MKKTLLFVAASVVLLAAPGTADATVWDVEADYVIATNPSAQWSYRSGTPGDRDSNALLSTYDAALTTWNPLLAGGGWTDGGGWNSPYYIFNENAAPQQWWSTVPEAIPVGAAFGYPYATGDLVLSWEAPSATTVDLTMNLTWLQDHAGAGDGVDWYLDKNNMAGNLASGTYDSLLNKLVPMGEEKVYAVSVLAGDRINLVIDAKGSGSSDGVYADFSITDVLTPPPPPPPCTPTVIPTGPWNVETQYSITADNCSDSTWSYRSGSRDSAGLLTDAIADFGTAVGSTWTADPPAGLVTGPSAWADDETFADAYILKNETAGDLIWSGNSFHPVDSVTVGPSTTDDAIISWLSPYTGWVDITAEFESRQSDAGSNGIIYYVDLNNTAGQLLTGGLAGAGAPVGTTSGTLATTVEVVAGDQINFGVDSNGSGAFDVTRITGTITVGAPPTPTVYPTGPWNFADQYSATTNLDANTWSYRSGISSNKTTSTRFTGTVGDPLVQWSPNVGASDGWGNTAGSVWDHAYFIKNDGSGASQVWPAASPAILASPVGAAFGAPSTAEDAVISWLAPSAMTVDISMDLTWMQDHAGGSNGIDWFITLNDTPIIAGDANEDGRVDEDDAAIVAANWQTMSGANLADGDFNSDGKVDDLDAVIMATNWGLLGAGVLASGTFGSETSLAGESTGIQSVLGVSVLAGDVIKLVLDSKGYGGNDPVYIDFSIAVSAAAVPEPGVCVLLAGMMLLLVARRRR